MYLYMYPLVASEGFKSKSKPLSKKRYKYHTVNGINNKL